MRYVTIMVLMLICGLIFAQQGSKGKMSRWVQMLVERQCAQHPEGVYDNGTGNNQFGGALMENLGRKASLQEEDQQEPHTIVFIQIDPSKTDQLMSEFDGKKWAQTDDIAIVEVAVSRLKELVEREEVLRIEANGRASLVTDTTGKVIDALPCYVASDSHSAYTGEGVVVGVMDVGFDLTHPAFYDATQTQYRIGALWDQLSIDDDDALPVGRQYVGKEALLACGFSTDSPIQQHGSHTAGIAAGGDATYRGIAYGSELCLVANAVSDNESYIDDIDKEMYTSAMDALGFKYIFDYAENAGKPCVVSFSEGYAPYMDEDDSLYTEFLDKLQGPGRIFVASAGNEGNALTYVEKPAGMETAGAFLSASNKKTALYRIKSDGPMTLHLYGYRNTSSIPTDQLQVSSTDERLVDGVADTIFFDKDTCAIAVYRAEKKLVTEDMYYFILSSNQNISSLPSLALVAEGSGSNIEMFGSSSYPFGNKSQDTRWNAATKGHNILAPGCFPSALCVGATIHRLSLMNYQKNKITMSSSTISGLREPYSSSGPSMGGLIKPEVMAPGTNIVSAFNSKFMETASAVNKNRQIYLTEVNGREYAWGINSGTSMSTPVVAGTLALWLQADPSLTREDVIDIISVTSRHIDQTATYPNNDDGYGEIQAHAGLVEVLRRKATGLDQLSYNQVRQAHASCSGGKLMVTFDHPASDKVLIRVYSVNGMLLASSYCPKGCLQNTIDLPSGTTGIIAIQMNSSDASVNGSILMKTQP